MLKIVNRSLCLVLLEILSYFPVSLPSPEDGEVVGAAPDRRLPPHHLQSHRAHHLHQLLLLSHLRSHSVWRTRGPIFRCLLSRKIPQGHFVPLVVSLRHKSAPNRFILYMGHFYYATQRNAQITPVLGEILRCVLFVILA